MPSNGTQVVKDYERAKQERQNHDERWERMAPFLAPSRMGINTQWSQGAKQTGGVYDSTTMLAAETMAMFIAGHIINPSQQWINWAMREPRYKKRGPIREWLEECRDRYLRRLASSLFYAEGPESLIDYGGFGTGFLLCEEIPQPVNRTINGFRGFYFNAVKTGRFCIREGADGLVDTFYREFKMTGFNMQQVWGDIPGALPEKVLNTLKEGKGDKEFTIIHAVYPRPFGERSYGAKAMPWASCWVEKESKHVCFESGYRTFPAAVPRYHKTPSEVYGRGRGDIAFPDTWTLNTAKRMGLEDWALKIKPPILVRHDSVFGSLRIVPGGPTSINTHGMRIQDVIMPMQTGSAPEVSNLKEEELRKSIREIFYVDAIRQLLQVEKSEMTAFEFAKKIELLFRLLGPVYGRLDWEYLTRISDIGFDNMYYGGAFSPPPPELDESDGVIDVTFQNPIAKAQRSGDAESLTMAINDLAPFSQLAPQAFDRIDPDKTTDGILDLRGVPAAWLRSDKAMMALRAARDEQNKKSNDLAMAEQAASAAGKAAPFLEASQPRGGAAPRAA